MDRPAYITRCPVCSCRLIVPDDYQTEAAILRVEGKRRKTRSTNPDCAITEHVRRNH